MKAARSQGRGLFERFLRLLRSFPPSGPVVVGVGFRSLKHDLGFRVWGLGFYTCDCGSQQLADHFLESRIETEIYMQRHGCLCSE